MATSNKQDRDYSEMINGTVTVSIPLSILEDSVEWIKKNMEPEDVFSEDQLSTWAKNNGYEQTI